MMRVLFLFPLLSLAAVSCAPKTTPEKSIAMAYRYTQVTWLPAEQHIRHGKDSAGIQVHTPDTRLSLHGERGGWWTSGTMARSMPYKWGGFDTPESFLKGLTQGKKAGDVATLWKRQNGDAVVSKESVGIDCSGFISRCWLLPKPYSTRQLPSICLPLDSWDELRMGDILLKDGHVILFEKWNYDRSEIIGYEAGPKPFWRVNSCGISKTRLRGEGYHPWRYRWMKEDKGFFLGLDASWARRSADSSDDSARLGRTRARRSPSNR